MTLAVFVAGLLLYVVIDHNILHPVSGFWPNLKQIGIEFAVFFAFMFSLVLAKSARPY
jgi:hypothetical protein